MSSIFKRELRAYFYTPLGYAYLFVFALVAGFLFYSGNLRLRSSDLSGYYAMLGYVWMLLTPVLFVRPAGAGRMPLNDTLLASAPISPQTVILGKFFAACVLLLLALVVTFIHVALAAYFGTLFWPEYGVILLGFLLQGTAFIALDLVAAALASGSATAVLLGFAFNFFVWLSSLIARNIPVQWLHDFLGFFNLYDRFQPFLGGQLSFAALIFYPAFTACMVFVAVRLLHWRGWEGRI